MSNAEAITAIPHENNNVPHGIVMPELGATINGEGQLVEDPTMLHETAAPAPVAAEPSASARRRARKGNMERYAGLPNQEFLAQIDEIERVAPEVLLEKGREIGTQVREDGTRTLEENLIKGEPDAVEDLIRAPFRGNHANVLLSSPYGADKSEVLLHILRVFGIMDGIVRVQATPDLRAREVHGNSVDLIKTTWEYGNQGEGDEDKGGDGIVPVVERLSGELEPMLVPNMRALVVDEVTSAQPRTLRTLSQPTGSRIAENGKGALTTYDELLLTLFAGNFFESLQTSYKLPGAVAVRMGIGVALAQEDNWKGILEGMSGAVKNGVPVWQTDPNGTAGWTATPERLETVTNPTEIKIASRAVPLVKVANKLLPYFMQMTVNTAHTLKRSGLNVGPGRPFRMMESDAKSRAMLDDREEVTKEDIRAAMETSLKAGLLGTGFDVNNIQEVTEKTENGEFTPPKHKKLWS